MFIHKVLITTVPFSDKDKLPLDLLDEAGYKNSMGMFQQNDNKTDSLFTVNEIQNRFYKIDFISKMGHQ